MNHRHVSQTYIDVVNNEFIELYDSPRRYRIASCAYTAYIKHNPKKPFYDNYYTTARRVLYGVYMPTDLCKLHCGRCACVYPFTGIRFPNPFFSKIISSSLTFFFSTFSADDNVCFSAANRDIVINENALHSRTL